MDNAEDSNKESSGEEEKEDEVGDLLSATVKEMRLFDEKINSGLLKIKAKTAAEIQDQRAVHELELMEYSNDPEEQSTETDKKFEISDSELNKTINSSDEEEEEEADKDKVEQKKCHEHKKSIFSKKNTALYNNDYEEKTPSPFQLNQMLKEKIRVAIKKPEEMKEESDKSTSKIFPAKEFQLSDKLHTENRISYRNSDHFTSSKTDENKERDTSPKRSSLLMRRSMKLGPTKSVDLGLSPTSVMKESLNKIKMAAQNSSYKIFLMNHYVSWELNGIKLVLNHFKNTEKKTKILVSNISSPNGAFLIRNLKKQKSDLNIYSETSIPYLYFHSEMIKKGDAKFKGSPPIRDEENRNILIESLQVNDLFHSVSSFHLQIPLEYKNIEKGNFKRCFNGFSVIGFNLQIVWSKLYIPIKKRFAKAPNETLMKEKIQNNMKKIVGLLCQKPAELLGLNRKGRIKEGFDADFVVFDPFNIVEINNKMIHLKHQKTFLLRNHKVYGKVLNTFLRGKCVYSEDKQFFEKIGKIIVKSN